VGLFYGSAQQAKQKTQYELSHIKYLLQAANLFNLGEGVYVNANGEIILNSIEASKNRQVLESLSVGLTNYPKLYTNEELLYLINGDYKSISSIILSEANDYLIQKGFRTINPKIVLTQDNSLYDYDSNTIYWNVNSGKRALEHEIGHCISKNIFGENLYNYGYNKLNPFDYNKILEIRSEAIASTIFGQKHIDYTSFMFDEWYNNINFIKNKNMEGDNFLVQTFLAEKYKSNSKHLMIDYINKNINYYLDSDFKMNSYQTEWDMQIKILQGGKN
jgi:hypothetical protein